MGSAQGEKFRAVVHIDCWSMPALWRTSAAKGCGGCFAALPAALRQNWQRASCLHRFSVVPFLQQGKCKTGRAGLRTAHGFLFFSF